MLASSRSDNDRLAELARDSGFGIDAVESLLRSVVRGGGSMAQFAHREFGGAGQWMQGGMLMVTEPASQDLKRRIAALCDALSEWVAAGSASLPPMRTGKDEHTVGFAEDPRNGSATAVEAPATRTWYPASLGRPDSSGSQDGMRYAWFADARRLAIEKEGEVTVYDTGEQRIAGVSQHQGAGRAVAFVGQSGALDLDRLPVVRDGTTRPMQANDVQTDAAGPHAADATTAVALAAPDRDPFDALERLADLHARGILDDGEFAGKKAELLARI